MNTYGGEPAHEILDLYPPQGQWTEEDYFALPERNRHLELSEGRIIVPPHPTPRHQRVVLKIASELRAFVREQRLGEVFVAPVPVRLWPGKIREPDVFFVAREHLDRVGDQVCGVPDLVVEVTSPGTERADRIEKFSEYARAGIREYWLVDPAAATVEVFVLERGVYVLAARGTFEERVASRLLPGFGVTLADT